MINYGHLLGLLQEFSPNFKFLYMDCVLGVAHSDLMQHE